MRCFVAFLVIFFAIGTSSALATDLTGRIKEETDLDDRIRKICQEHCQGNRRKGSLESLSVNRIDDDRFYVRARARLRNRHHVDTLIGGGFQAYSYTVDVLAEGVLDTRDCMLTINDIRVENDRLGLTSLARREEGKSHKIDSCSNFVRDL